MRPPHKKNFSSSRSPQQGRPSFNKGPRSSHRANENNRRGDTPEGRWVIGIHSCEEVLRIRPKAVKKIWIREDYEETKGFTKLIDLLEKNRLKPQVKTSGQIDAVGHGHQGIAIDVAEGPVLDWENFKKPTRQVVLILDGIEDPHNLGSILRTAWLVGCTGIFIPNDRAVGLTPAAAKVASGGAEHVPIERFSNLASAIKQLKDDGFWVYGLSENGTRKPWEFQLPEKVAWVVGSEGEGLRITTERACDELVRIPQVESGSSYNASIAVAMAFSETCRQHENPQ